MSKMSATAMWSPVTNVGNGVYDPVTTADNVQIRDPDDDSYWKRGANARTYKFGTYRKTGVKAWCDELRNRTRPACLIIVSVVFLVLLLLILIVVVASNAPKTPFTAPLYEEWKNKSEGLTFMPVGESKTVYIRFQPLEKSDTNKLVHYLDEAVYDYETLHQQDEKLFVDCNATYAPEDKVCKQSYHDFGVDCNHASGYGYHAGSPCIMIFLNLPSNLSMKPLQQNDPFYDQAVKALGDRFSSDHIGLSCEPDKSDEAFIRKSTTGHPIEYFPKLGFQAYIYRKRTIDRFITPAVMVQFRTLQEFHPVRIECTAWGRAYNSEGFAINHDMFGTSFVLHIA